MKRISYNNIESMAVQKYLGCITKLTVHTKDGAVRIYGQDKKDIRYNSVPECVWKFLASMKNQNIICETSSELGALMTTIYSL